MPSYSELKKGITFVLEKELYEIIESAPHFQARGHSVLKTKLRNLKTGNVISRTFHPSDSFEDADIEKKEATFLYSNRGKYFFCEKNNPSNRFDLTEEQIGAKKSLLKANQQVEALIFEEKIINISLPIKVNVKVTEAPPSLKGERAQSGTKLVTLETGSKINVPLFVKAGDVIEVNTQTGEYVRRIE